MQFAILWKAKQPLHLCARIKGQRARSHLHNEDIMSQTSSLSALLVKELGVGRTSKPVWEAFELTFKYKQLCSIRLSATRSDYISQNLNTL